MKSSHILSGRVFTFLTRIGAFLLNFSTIIWVTKALGPKDIGIYTLPTLVPMTLAGFGMPNIGFANMYYYGKGEYEPIFM